LRPARRERNTARGADEIAYSEFIDRSSRAAEAEVAPNARSLRAIRDALLGEAAMNR
jgi:hypothetical protein